MSTAQAQQDRASELTWAKNPEVRSANWHFTSRCNYRCTFCCKQNLGGDLSSLNDAGIVLDHLIRLGMDKINFVGGEPFCHPMIIDLIVMAKEKGFTTSLTTNGSLLTKEKLEKLHGYIDWIGISIDSSSEEVEKQFGRGNGNHVSQVISTARLVQKFGIKLKINTTVTRVNMTEDLRPLISRISPDRWKIFQFLHIPGQNDEAVETLSISNKEFNQYKDRNSNITLKNGISPVFERSEEMMDSYFMISPSGNVILNNKFPVEEIPLADVSRESLPTIMNIGAYHSRGAIYDWKH